MKTGNSKSTIIVISMGFLILHLMFSWQWAIYLSLIVGLIGILSDALSRMIEAGWMKLANVLSYVIPSILLSIVFYLLLTPLSLISKMFTKDPLMLSKDYSTYFLNTDKTLDKASFKKTW